MCLIAYQRAGASLPIATLQEMIRRNDDGYGIVRWNALGLPYVHKRSMDNGSFVDDVLSLSGEPILVHARIATHGDKDLANTHPYEFFPEGDTEKHPLYLMHNGVFPFDSVKDDPHSDTYYFARFMEQQRDILNTLYDPQYLEVLESMIGSNKVAFALPGGDVVILNEHLGTWRDNVWYSNTLSFPYATKYFSNNSDSSNNVKTYAGGYSQVSADERWWDNLEEVWEERPGSEGQVPAMVLIGWRDQTNGDFIPTASYKAQLAVAAGIEEDRLVGDDEDEKARASFADASKRLREENREYYTNRASDDGPAYEGSDDAYEDEDEDDLTTLSTPERYQQAVDLMNGWDAEVKGTMLKDGTFDFKLLEDAALVIGFDVAVSKEEVVGTAIRLILQRYFKLLAKAQASKPAETPQVATVTDITERLAQKADEALIEAKQKLSAEPEEKPRLNRKQRRALLHSSQQQTAAAPAVIL